MIWKCVTTVTRNILSRWAEVGLRWTLMMLVYYEQLCYLRTPQNVARFVKSRRFPGAEREHGQYVNCGGKCVWKGRRMLEVALKLTFHE